MASHVEDPDVFQRKFQQKFAEQYGQDATPQGPNLARPVVMGESEKKSPFCFQNILMLILAIVVFYVSDFARVFMYDQRIYTTWFWIGSTAMTIHIGICLFLAIYCNFLKKIGPDEWEQRYPKAIPVAAFTIIIGILCLSVALWPVWGIFGPVILAILFLGIVVVVAMFG